MCFYLLIFFSLYFLWCINSNAHSLFFTLKDATKYGLPLTIIEYKLFPFKLSVTSLLKPSHCVQLTLHLFPVLTKPV